MNVSTRFLNRQAVKFGLGMRAIDRYRANRHVSKACRLLAKRHQLPLSYIIKYSMQEEMRSYGRIVESRQKGARTPTQRDSSTTSGRSWGDQNQDQEAPEAGRYPQGSPEGADRRGRDGGRGNELHSHDYEDVAGEIEHLLNQGVNEPGVANGALEDHRDDPNPNQESRSGGLTTECQQCGLMYDPKIYSTWCSTCQAEYLTD